ncbi:MAG TPA: histidine kinase dimerization/phospho-acceptor domain-containing protein, partial [Candidatus Nitrosotalea sp.]|nr:histidine kinase dimerization/phospho-acceptor domain-containing protein [Candidatus Nitrosotalea sp.]
MLVEKHNNTYHKINQETSRDELERYFSSLVQTEFVSMAGHEMKTSIQAILTYAELLQDKHDRHREDYA